ISIWKIHKNLKHKIMNTPEKIFVFHVCIYIDKRNLILRVKIIMNILIFQFDGKNSLFSEYKYAKTR
ncbi:hypothetical protein R7X43_03375, partial [Mesomycoplasma ovipneumoniae]|uniref:hypothetical protein n=1 Tax=Mesomycoplasma ovipneumoniae TaxID=29562 RepID=UPI00296573C8